MPIKKKNIKLRFTGKFIFLINIFFIFCLIIASFAHRINPVKFYPLAFFGISLIYFFAINCIFLIYWIIRKRWLFIYSAFALIISLPVMTKIFSFRFNKIEETNTKSLKILSYNVNVFDLYNYDKKWVTNPEKRNQIFHFLKQEQPDIICFQEFVDHRAKTFKILDTLPSLLKAKNVHFEYTKSSKKIDYFGIATFSSYPIISKRKINLKSSSNNIAIVTDIKVHNKIIRVFNVHLQSIRFGETDYRFAEKFKSMENFEIENELKTGSKKILQRLKKAFIKRGIQTNILVPFINSSPYPVIICGDFNDTPSSYTYYSLANNLDDAFLESGFGFGKTYAGTIFPSFRIDYILHSKTLTSSDFTLHNIKYSDHYPISCKISIK